MSPIPPPAHIRRTPPSKCQSAFEKISPQYADIERECNIIDIAAEVSGSVGLAGDANIGAHVAMFEAIYGSAPDIAGPATRKLVGN